MALPFLHQHIVANVSALKVKTSSAKRKSIFAQSIQHFIKKSTLNLEQKTSANNGSDFSGGCFG